MDAIKCGAISIAETFLVGRSSNLDNLYVFAILFVVQYIGLKLFNVVIWPFLFSPLRNLPGPKVFGKHLRL